MYSAARAQVEQVKVMLTYAQVTSPIDGIVTERRIEAGDLANPGHAAAGGLRSPAHAPGRPRCPCV